MKSQQLFKKILFPTDFSESSNNVLHYVVELSKACEADLIVLHTFRFNNSILDSNNIREAKKNLETKAFNQFKLLDDQHLKSSGLHYLFQSEIGFLSDRIVSNVKEHSIDLLVLCSTIQEELKEGYRELMAEIGCPVLFIPKGYGNPAQTSVWKTAEQTTPPSPQTPEEIYIPPAGLL